MSDDKIYVGTVDGRLFAVDMKTSRPVWETKLINSEKLTVGFTGAPLDVKDKVIIGAQGGEWPGRGSARFWRAQGNAMLADSYAQLKVVLDDARVNTIPDLRLRWYDEPMRRAATERSRRKSPKACRPSRRVRRRRP
jgi:PQQ enzyme repeat